MKITNEDRHTRITHEAIYQLDELLGLMVEQRAGGGYDLRIRSLAVRGQQLSSALMSLLTDEVGVDLELCERAVYGLVQVHDEEQ